MRARPGAAELLEEARRTLMEEVLPVVAEEGRYPVRMVARALGMALRELQAGAQDLERELAAFRSLYGEEAVRDDERGLEPLLADLNRRFARDIRAGELDGACAQGVRALLREQVRARLALSNPRRLAATRDEARAR